MPFSLWNILWQVLAQLEIHKPNFAQASNKTATKDNYHNPMSTYLSEKPVFSRHHPFSWGCGRERQKEASEEWKGEVLLRHRECPHGCPFSSAISAEATPGRALLVVKLRNNSSAEACKSGYLISWKYSRGKICSKPQLYVTEHKGATCSHSPPSHGQEE